MYAFPLSFVIPADSPRDWTAAGTGMLLIGGYTPDPKTAPIPHRGAQGTAGTV